MVHSFKSSSKLMVVLLLAIVLAGCLGGSPGGGGSPNTPKGKGNIVGRVIDEAGDGVFGAIVTLDQPLVAAQTDNQGRYMLNDVPVGTYRIAVNMPGHVARKAPAAAGTSSTPLTTLDYDAWAAQALNALTPAASDVRVTVVANETAQADDILLYPQPNVVDNVGISAVTPDITTPLTAGTSVDLELGLFYSLESAPEALLIVAVGYGNALLDTAAAYVTAGSGTASLTLPVEVPHAARLTLQTFLFNANMVPLAENMQQAHRILGSQAPAAPTLEVAGSDISGVTLRWSGGTTTNFYRYLIYRHPSQPTNESGTLIGLVADPTVTTLVDEDIILGETYAYRLYLETYDGQLYPSNDVTVTYAGLSVTEIPFANPYSINNLIMDPIRDRLYIVTSNPDEITLLSTEDDSIEQVIPLDCPPAQSTITPDGTYLFLTCLKQKMLVRVSLASTSPQIDYFSDLGAPYYPAVDSASQTLYLSDQREEIVTVLEINNMANRRIEPMVFRPVALALSPDDSLLITVGRPAASYSRPAMQTYSTEDFAPAVGWYGEAYLDDVNGKLNVHPIRNEFYFDETVFDLDTGYRAETLTAKVRAVGLSGKYLYGTGPRSGPWMSIFAWNGSTWTEFLRLGTKYAEAMALTPDESKVYIVNRDIGVRVIDLRNLNLH